MMRFFTLLLFVSLVGSMNAQIIWGGPGDANSEFDGGPNDWVIEALSDEDALWIWEADGRNELGAYSGGDAGADPIISPSVANGAMGFDADFYDNGGTQGAFGTGIAPSPSRGTLTSPPMDCTGFENVALTFYQYYRNFTGTTRSVNVSIDGGMTWVPFLLVSAPVNQASEQNDRELLDISSIAANQPDVRIQFDYNSEYYFWLIDDVSLIVPPTNNLALWRANLPPPAWTTPEHMIKADTFDFALEIINRAAFDNMGGSVTAEILDNSGAAVYTFTEDFGMIPADDTLFYVFDAQVVPDDITLTEGAYTVNYEITSIEEDFDVADNSFAIDFNISTNLFQGNNEISNAFNFGAGTIPGVTFRTGALAANTTFRVDSVTLGGASNDAITNPEASVFVFKVKNQLSDELDPIFTATNLGTPDDEHENLENVGFGFFSAPSLANFEEPTIELFNNEGTDFLFLEENTTYLIATQWNETMPFFNASDDFFYYQGTNMAFVNGWGTVQTLAWGIPLQINVESTINAEEVELAEDVMSVFPNPAKDFTSVNLAFEVPTSATIILTDALGRFVASQAVENVTATKVNFDVSTLPAGSYNFQIRTSENAVSTKSLMIVD